MLIKTKLNADQLYKLVKMVGDTRDLRPAGKTGRARDGRNAFKLTLVPIGDRYRRTSASAFRPGRRVFAVCAHGHYFFIRMLLDKDPSATVQSHAAYVDAENLQEVWAELQHRNIGSMMFPVTYASACLC